MRDARQSAEDDRILADAITLNANPDDSNSWDNIVDVVSNFVRKIALDIEDSIVQDIRVVMPDFDLNEPAPSCGVNIRDS